MNKYNITTEDLLFIVVNNKTTFGLKDHYVVNDIRIIFGNNYNYYDKMAFEIKYFANVKNIKKNEYSNSEELFKLYNSTVMRIRKEKLKKLKN